MPRPNKGIHIKYRKDKACWVVGEYINMQFKRYRTGISSNTLAQKELEEVIAERTRPEGSEYEITLGQLVTYYINEHVPTLSKPETALKCFERLLPFWGNLKITDIKKSKSLDYIQYRKKEFTVWQKESPRTKTKPLSEATIRRELEQLQAAISYCYRDNVINISPYVWKPKRGKARDRWLTKREAAALLREARNYSRVSDYLPLYILIGLYTGARADAIKNLRWCDVDFRTGIINFKNQGEAHNKKKSRVPAPKRLLRELRKARKRGVEMGYVVHKNQKKLGEIKNGLTTCYKRAGIEKVTSHTLRHTAASWMVQKGVALPKVAKYLNTTTQVIETNYGHLATDHLKEVLESYG